MTVTAGYRAAHREPGLAEMLSLTRWRKLTAEAVALLAVMTVVQHWLGGFAFPGMPHPYWFAVLLAASQYGMSGGVIAVLVASSLYWLELSPPSAAQEFYAYAGSVAIQPALWLATVLVIGGLRNLHIHQAEETAELLAASERRADDLSVALERAVAEISALERRIAADMCSVAALARGLSLLDLSDRQAAAATYGEVFRAGFGAEGVTVYLKGPDGYRPVDAPEQDAPRSASGMTSGLDTRPWTTVDDIIAANGGDDAADNGGSDASAIVCQVVRIPPSDGGEDPLAAVVCRLPGPQDVRTSRRRAEDLGRAFATILAACPHSRASEPR